MDNWHSLAETTDIQYDISYISVALSEFENMHEYFPPIGIGTGTLDSRAFSK
jgi:hypothetical protein